jgi:hypothetical protein
VVVLIVRIRKVVGYTTHESLVPHGGVEKRVALARSGVEEPAMGIVERGGVMYPATGYKYSGAIAKHEAPR